MKFTIVIDDFSIGKRKYIKVISKRKRSLENIQTFIDRTIGDRFYYTKQITDTHYEVDSNELTFNRRGDPLTKSGLTRKLNDLVRKYGWVRIE